MIQTEAKYDMPIIYVQGPKLMSLFDNKRDGKT